MTAKLHRKISPPFKAIFYSKIYIDPSQATNHLSSNNQDAGSWPAYGVGAGGGTTSGGSSNSSTVGGTYPPYLGCNVTSSPSTTYNPPVLTYTDLTGGGAGSNSTATSNNNNNGLHPSITHGQIVPTTTGTFQNKASLLFI